MDYWIKLYIEIIDDPKMAMLPDRLWRRAIEMMMLAGRYGGVSGSGELPNAKTIAWWLRAPEEEVDNDLHALEPTGIVKHLPNDGWMVVNFSKRQAPMTPAEKQQRYRGKRHHEQYSSGQDGGDDPDDEKEAEADKSAAAAEKKVSKTTPEEQAWLTKIIEAFGERFQNPIQVKTALQIRSQFGEDKGWQAIFYYAGRGRPIGEGVSRAFQALPNWGRYEPYAKRGNGSNGSSGQQPAQKGGFDAKFAITQLGWTVDECKDRMVEMDYKPDEIEKQLAEVSV